MRKDEDVPIDSVLARWDESPELAEHGVAFLLWGLLDDIVDGHFAAVQSLDDEIEALEDLLFDAAPRNTEVQRRSFELRKSLVRLRRVVLPMREVVNSLMRRDLHVLDAAMAPYYQDVYDHVLRATEWTESLRDLVTTILETNLTIQGNRMNLVMKKVTSWAAIIAVPTAITGLLRAEPPVPRIRHALGVLALERPDRRDLGRPLRRLPPERLAVAGRPGNVGPEMAAPGRRLALSSVAASPPGLLAPCLRPGRGTSLPADPGSSPQAGFRAERPRTTHSPGRRREELVGAAIREASERFDHAQLRGSLVADQPADVGTADHHAGLREPGSLDQALHPRAARRRALDGLRDQHGGLVVEGGRRRDDPHAATLVDAAGVRGVRRDQHGGRRARSRSPPRSSRRSCR